MIVAIPVWSDQISTVFDFAHHILLVELDAGNEIGRNEHPLQEGPPIFRANKLSHFGVDVLNAYLTGRLADSRFCLPGCRPDARKDWKRRHRLSGSR